MRGSPFGHHCWRVNKMRSAGSLRNEAAAAYLLGGGAVKVPYKTGLSREPWVRRACCAGVDAGETSKYKAIHPGRARRGAVTNPPADRGLAPTSSFQSDSAAAPPGTSTRSRTNAEFAIRRSRRTSAYGTQGRQPTDRCRCEGGFGIDLGDRPVRRATSGSWVSKVHQILGWRTSSISRRWSSRSCEAAPGPERVHRNRQRGCRFAGIVRAG